MRLTLTAILAFATIAAVAQLPMKAPGSMNPALVTGGTYTADPDHTLIRWSVDHLGFTDYFGIFGDVAGTLTIDPKHPNAAKVDMTIPVSKVTTANAALTAHLLRAGKDGGKADFFGPAPADAHFVSTRVVATGTKARINGNLTLNGVTRPIVLDAKLHGAGTMPGMGGSPARENVGFDATTTIRRSDFGLSQGIPLISDQVALTIAAAFRK